MGELTRGLYRGLFWHTVSTVSKLTSLPLSIPPLPATSCVLAVWATPPQSLT